MILNFDSKEKRNRNQNSDASDCEEISVNSFFFQMNIWWMSFNIERHRWLNNSLWYNLMIILRLPRNRTFGLKFSLILIMRKRKKKKFRLITFVCKESESNSNRSKIWRELFCLSLLNPKESISIEVKKELFDSHNILANSLQRSMIDWLNQSDCLKCDWIFGEEKSDQNKS